MTCIAGLVEKGTVYIGADSAAVAGWSLNVRADPKVFRRGEYGFGFTYSFRMGQLLRYALQLPKRPPRMSADKFFTTLFMDRVRSCFRKGGYLTKKDGYESGGSFMIGYRAELFIIHEDFQVQRPTEPFAAIGSGQEVAEGALFTLVHSAIECPPGAKIDLALTAAERFNAGVRGPFHVVRVPRGRS